MSLEKIIEEAEKESKLLANEINQWLLSETGSFLKEDEQMHSRSRRSVDVDIGELGPDTNLLSEISQHITRREVSNNGKEHKNDHKKKKSGPMKKRKTKTTKIKRAEKKSQGKNRKKKNSKLEKQGYLIRAKKNFKEKKRQKQTDELSKLKLVKELIGAGLEKKKDLGVPEKAYSQLIEMIATSAQPIIETSSKKSDIARPASSLNKLTKKHKRVLAILAKMAPDVLRKFFHRKGFDKYWKIMENFRKKKSVKRTKKRTSKDVKNVNDKVVSSRKNNKPTSRSKQKKDFIPKITSKGSSKAKSKAPKSSSERKVVFLKHVRGVPPKTPKIIPEAKGKKEVVANVTKGMKIDKIWHKADKKEKGKNLVQQNRKAVPRARKNEKTPSRALKAKRVVRKKKKPDKNVKPEKALQRSNLTTLHSVTEKSSVKPKFHDEKGATKTRKELGKQVLKTAATGKSLSPKNTSNKISSPSVKDKASHMKSPLHQSKPVPMVKPIRNVLNKNSSAKPSKPDSLKKLASKHQGRKVIDVTSPSNSPSKGGSKIINDGKHKGAVKFHVNATTHAQNPGHNDSNQVPHENLHVSKIEFLKGKVTKANNLKLKVARALLAHCETQNRLRQVFDDVNSSLKKAAALAKAIGTKFGIRQSDINKITSHHTEEAVEQFLNNLF